MTEKTFSSIDGLRTAATERGIKMATLAIAWVISHPQVTAALIGPRRLEHYPELLAAADLKLSQPERNEIAARMEAA
jgi:aryl-alcohol dehydrogenase (NADP+)